MKKDLLIDTIIRYIVPVFSKKNKQIKKRSRLEELLEQKYYKPKYNFIDELLKSVSKDKRIRLEKSETNLETIKKQNNVLNKLAYSAVFRREKETKSDSGYRISIKYEETEIEERIKFTVEFDTANKEAIENNPSKNNYNNKKTLEKDKNENRNKYSFDIARKKENITKDNYSVHLVYENTYEGERLSVNYRSTLGSYLSKREESLSNFEDRVPGKHVDVLPKSVMGGILGFTYLGQDRMALRDDLIGMKKMVDIHESIHTPDEYETRVLTDWIMSKARTKYVK